VVGLGRIVEGRFVAAVEPRHPANGLDRHGNG
jgi:hypothetical protein